MTSELSIFAARLREHFGFWSEEFSLGDARNDPAYRQHADIEFNGLAIMLFTLQFKFNAPYRKICEVREVLPNQIHHWTQIPPVPTAAFKELELTCLAPDQRTRVFHSSGTTEQRPSRHFHNAESLAVYETSLWPWFAERVAADVRRLNSTAERCQSLLTSAATSKVVILTPPLAQAPHSSLVYMFDFVRRQSGADAKAFLGRAGEDGAWTLDVEAAINALAEPDDKPRLVLGTAFSFVHLLDAMGAENLAVRLPAGSRVLETGGYKGRSRTMPREELHRLITERLGVPVENIICEYGMSELSSQAYDSVSLKSDASSLKSEHIFHFPPWARARVVSPETSRDVAEGETGLLQVFDLANVFSVMAIQTEDLAVRRGEGFELVGRVQLAEPRGCSLMTA